MIDFRVEQEDSVYPMVPAGADLHEMIRRPMPNVPIAETATQDEMQIKESRMMHHTFVALVEDKPGVLNRVASLFRRRTFNIESLTVGHTEQAGVSRMTIVVDSDDLSARARDSQPV